MAVDSPPTREGELRAQSQRDPVWAPSRLFRCLGLLVLLGGLVVACGGSDDGTDPAGSTDSSIDTTEPGSVDNGNGNGSGSGPRPAGAVLNVPAIGGNDVDSVRADAERKFKQVCGGTLCVTLVVVVPPEPPGEDCDVDFVGTSPTEGSQVQRGSTVRLLFELDSCEPSETETTDPEPSIAPPTTDDPPATTND